MALSQRASLRKRFRPRASSVFAVVGLLSLLALPAIGSQLYFRHDDASFILLAARFRGSWLGLFSTDPSSNVWGALSGMAGYYRPTGYALAIAMVRLVGVNAPLLMALAGAAMGAALALYYWSARIIAGPLKAVIALYVALLLGGPLLYQSFRLMVPWGYLLIMAAVACLLLGAKRRSTLLIILGGLFWLFSSSRQSALLLVPAVVLSALIAIPALTASWPSRAAAVRRFTLLLGPFIAGVAALVIVDSLSRGSAALSLDLGHFAERYQFYAETLFGGPRSVLLMPPLYCFGGMLRGKRVISATAPAGLEVLPLAVAIAGTVVVALLPVLGPVALVAAGVVAARRTRALWVGTTWFAVGFAVYLVPEYYHQAYILEAFLGLALVVACCTPPLARAAYSTFRALLGGRRLVRVITMGAVGIVLTSCVLAGALIGPRMLSSARSALTGLMDSNRTLGDCVAYFTALPDGEATILAFSNEQRGLYDEDWRSRGLAYRATVVPVMDSPQLHDMLEALRGPDMVLEQFADPGGTTVREGAPLYGIAFGEAESKAMAESWITTPVTRFAHGSSMCTVFRLRPPPR